MAASPSKPSHTSLATKDAMFLFDLFRESPTPILIQIGPFAQKTGAKPNTIIKRLAGIKARNGLNISTTLGNYKHPSPSKDGGIKVQSTKKTVKKEKYQLCDSNAGLGTKNEDREAVYMASGGLGPGSDAGKALPTPTASPSSSISSPRGFYQNHHVQPYNYSDPALDSINLDSGHSKRTFQQTLESKSERSDLDGTTLKRVKAE